MKFKAGDRVFINSYKGCKELYPLYIEYPITKLGMAGVLQKHSYGSTCIVLFDDHRNGLMVNIKDLEFESLKDTPLFEALL